MELIWNRCGDQDGSGEIPWVTPTGPWADTTVRSVEKNFNYAERAVVLRSAYGPAPLAERDVRDVDSDGDRIPDRGAVGGLVAGIGGRARLPFGLG